jgi:2-dehydro-3-deoxyglucarate aldolase/4-hydroxy-2-oxoheptanedioate aldolase
MSLDFKKRLAGGDTMIGTIMSLPSLEVAEILSNSGFDWLFVDMEHTPLDFQLVQRVLQVADSRVSCLVRVPSPQEAWVKKCLDMGASGIIFPQVNSAEQARRVVEVCKYPPLGKRSVGIARAHAYGMKFDEYMTRANEDIAIVVQIEHIDAVNAIESISKISGIDAFFIGPYDLSASLGKTAESDDPQVQAAIARVEQCVKAEGLPLGIFGTDVAAVEKYVASGYQLVAVGLDTMLLADAAAAIIRTLRSRHSSECPPA